MKKNDIFMIQGTEYKAMTMELLKKTDLASDIGDRAKRIGLKPNLAVSRPASSGATTHPEILDGILTYLHEKGFLNIVVLESSWVGDHTSDAVRVSGILGVCENHNVPFLDLQKDAYTSCEASGMNIDVCDQVLSIDYLINLPVLKGHCQTTITCALKNSKGLLPDSEKRRFHTLGLHKPIAHLNTVIHQDFILVDNICGDLDFEEGGNPVPMNRLLAFKDPVLCDSYVAESMGYSPNDIEYIRLAEKLGIGSSDTSRAEKIDLSPNGFYSEMPRPTRRVEQLAKYIEQRDACSACYGSLIYALDRLNGEGMLYKIPPKSISIGQGFQGKEGPLGIGNCTKCFQNTLPGCPPKAIDIVRFLKKADFL